MIGADWRLRRDDVRRVAIDGHALLVIQVPKAPRSLRPVHLNGSWDTKTYLRVHEGDRVADREVARRMLADAQPDHDAQVLDGYGVADFHAESVRQYRQLLASKRPDHPFLREDDTGFLRQIGALRRDLVCACCAILRATSSSTPACCSSLPSRCGSAE